jgi:hypothetical protein
MRFLYPIDRDRPAGNWSAIVRAAQDDTTYTIDGAALPRIPFGTIPPPAGSRWPFCRGCAAGRGELHVPGCTAEECPVCGGGFVSCDCAVDDDLEHDDREVRE